MYYITSFRLQVFGQYLSRPRMTDSVKELSFSINWTTQYANCAWYRLKHLTLCRGMSTLTRNCLCSFFKGSANPLIMLMKAKIFVYINLIKIDLHINYKL